MSCQPAELRLQLPYPPSANAYWRAARGRGMVPSTKALRYKAEVSALVAALRVQPLVGPVRLTVRLYRQRRSGDLDNALKVLLDALNGLAWLDDDQVVHLTAERHDDAAAPRVELHATAERFASAPEVAAHRAAWSARATKARETRNRNRAAAALGRRALPTPATYHPKKETP